MATQQRPRRPTPAVPKKDGGPLWNFLAALSLICSVLIFIGSALPSWRETDAVTYHYMSGGVGATHVYRPSYYGLYIVSFNGGAINKNWHRLQLQICTGIEALAPLNQALDILTDVSCGSACIGHFRTRCQVYIRLSFWGYLTLGVLIVVGCLGVVASAWIFMFGPHRTILQLLWTGSSVVALCVTGFWIMTSNDGFRALYSDSQFPYASLSTAAFVALAGMFGLLLCGLLALLLTYLADRTEWTAKQAAIQQKILAEDGPLGPEGFIGGLPGGLVGSPPYAFAPGGTRGLPPLPPTAVSGRPLPLPQQAGWSPQGKFPGPPLAPRPALPPPGYTLQRQYQPNLF